VFCISYLTYFKEKRWLLKAFIINFANINVYQKK
jgi:hypothetical protein